jgi:hypothetical protein
MSSVEDTTKALASARLEEVERTDDTRPPYFLTYTEVKLLGIAGVNYIYYHCNQKLIALTGWVLLGW